MPVTVVLQGLTTWATLIALFLVSSRATGSAMWGLVAITLVSLNELWVVESLRQRETFLYAAVLIALVGLVVYKPRWRGIATGALCAAGWLTRPTGVVLFPAVLLLHWRDTRRSGTRIGVRTGLALAASFGIPLFLWLGYQQLHFGTVTVAGNDSATNLLKGNNDALRAIYPYIDVDRLAPVLLEPLAETTRARGGDVRRVYIRRALEFVAESPVEAVSLVPRKLAAFFVPIYFPLGSGTARQTSSGEWRIDDYEPRPLGQGDGVMALPGVVAFFVALARWRTLSSASVLVVLAVGMTAAVHVATFAQTRFRLPYDPILALLCEQMAASALGGKSEPTDSELR